VVSPERPPNAGVFDLTFAFRSRLADWTIVSYGQTLYTAQVHRSSCEYGVASRYRTSLNALSVLQDRRPPLFLGVLCSSSGFTANPSCLYVGVPVRAVETPAATDCSHDCRQQRAWNLYRSRGPGGPFAAHATRCRPFCHTGIDLQSLHRVSRISGSRHSSQILNNLADLCMFRLE
jgi:hypothetical protein